MRTPRDTPEITLVGAGLAGSLLALAIFLARRGYRDRFEEVYQFVEILRKTRRHDAATRNHKDVSLPPR